MCLENCSGYATIEHVKEIIYYKTESGKIPFKTWLDNLDKSLSISVTKRLIKLESGLYGDNKQLSPGLYELKFTNGLRIYYHEEGSAIIILLCAGAKQRQSRDIEIAREFLKDYIRRKNK